MVERGGGEDEIHSVGKRLPSSKASKARECGGKGPVPREEERVHLSFWGRAQTREKI